MTRDEPTIARHRRSRATTTRKNSSTSEPRRFTVVKILQWQNSITKRMIALQNWKRRTINAVKLLKDRLAASSGQLLGRVAKNGSELSFKS